MNSLRGKAVSLRTYSEPKKRVGELLVDEGLVSGLDLAKALLHQRQCGGKIIDILVALGALHPDAVVDFMGRQPGVPSLKLCNYSVRRDVVSQVPKELAVKHEVFPIEILGRVLTLGMVCPLDKTAIAELEKVTEFKVRPILCLPEDIRSAINRYYARKEEVVTLSWHTLQPKHTEFAVIDRK